MSFDPTKTYRSVVDIDGNIFAFQAGRYYDRYGNSFTTLPVNKEGYAPPTDVEITPEFLGDTLVINADASGTGNDWKYTIARPTGTMTAAQTLTLPATGGTAARTQDKLSAFAATTSAELAGVISDEEGTSGGFVRATGAALAPVSINGVTTDSTTNKPVTAASLNGGTLPASVTTLAATSLNGVTIDTTTNKPVTAASLAGGTLPASVTTLSATADSLVLNSDATEAAADWRYTVQRPAAGMTADATLTLPATSGTAARIEDKLSAFAATTSAELAGVISDEEGTSGGFVRATGCALAPVSINGVTTDSTTNKPVTAASLAGGTLPASITTLSATADSVLLNSDAAGSGADWTLTLTRPTSGMAAAATITLPTATGNLARTQDKLSVFAATTSSELAGVISDETGSGALVFATAPSFVAPTTLTAVSDVAAQGAELTTNGTFTGDASGWTLGTNWAYGTNNVILTLDGSAEGTLSQDVSVTSGKFYLIGWSQTSSIVGNGKLTPSLGATTGVAQINTGTGATTSFQILQAAATGSVALTFTPTDVTSTGTITVDTVTCTEITPIEASQVLKDTTAATQLEQRIARTTTGQNILIGTDAGKFVTTANKNVSLGYGALTKVTTGTQNVAIGAAALLNLTSTSNNIAIGTSALTAHIVGGSNIAVGTNALAADISGASNLAIGQQALAANVNGINNLGLGTQALTANTGGQNNVAVGLQSLQTVNTGSYNSGVGTNSGNDITSGTHNTCIGYATGYGITTGSGNTILGANVSGLSSSLASNIILASGTTGIIRARFDGTNWAFSGGIGYATGQGGTVTQITSRTTGVTLDKICGAITLVSAAGSTSWQSFTVTNSTVAATDTVIVNQKSGTDLNMIHVTAIADGSFQISFATTGGTTTEQPVFNFSVLKAVAA